jgi:CheY-like chemotaxis protein
MRIKYNVLWFENEPAWLRPAKKNLSTYLEDFAFLLEVTEEKDGSNVPELIQKISDCQLDIDVIFMDYQLAQESKGEKIIETIRDNQLFTEILFYSNRVDVKDIIENAIGSVEGIYYSDRDSFLDKAKLVIRHSIKKVQEVNSMRGLIMAATSDLDALMKEIISIFYAKFPAEKHTNVTEGIFSDVSTQIESKKKLFDKLRGKNQVDKLMKDNVLFDAHKKALATQKIIDELLDERISKFKKDAFFNAYKDDVIGVRNDFAHVVDCLNSDGKRVLKSNSGEKEFTDQGCIDARKKLIEHLGNVELIIMVLLEEAEALLETSSTTGNFNTV